MEKLPSLHLHNMKKILLVYLSSLLHVFRLCAQEKLAGNYDSRYHTFRPTDANILVASFGNDTLAPFMIKGKNPFEDENNRVGFIDTTGLVVIKPEYNNCSEFSGSYALVVKKSSRQNKYGLIDRNGKVTLPLEYSSLSKCLNGLLMVGKDGKIGLVTPIGRVIISPNKYSGYAKPRPVYLEADDTPRGFVWFLLRAGTVQFAKYIGVKADSKWAVIDSTGKEIIPPRFDGIGIFNNGVAAVKIGQKFGVINSKGNMLIPALYDGIELTGKRFVYAVIGGKTGVLTLNNKVIIPLDFFKITDFQKGYIADDSENKKTLYDAKGNRIAKMSYNPTLNFPVWGLRGQGFFVYNKSDEKFHPYEDIVDRQADEDYHRQLFFLRNKKWGIMDTTGREITPPVYDQIDYEKLNYLDDDQHKLIAVKQDGSWGIVNKKGKVLLPFDYDDLLVAKDKLIVKKGNKYGVFSDRVIKLTPVKYDSIAVIHSDDLYDRLNPGNSVRLFISAMINKNWGLVSNSGKELTTFSFDTYLRFLHNLALTKIKGKLGVTNAQGKQIAACIYDKIIVAPDYNNSFYYDGRIIVKRAGRYGLIDSSGKQIAPAIYEDITQLRYSLAGKYQVVHKGKTGLIDGITGKVIVPCEYDDFKVYGNDIAKVSSPQINTEDPLYIIAKKDESYGLIDSNGKICLPFKYYRIYNNYPYGYEVYLSNNERQVLGKNLKLIAPIK